jgi:hypothetical protein
MCKLFPREWLAHALQSASLLLGRVLHSCRGECFTPASKSASLLPRRASYYFYGWKKNKICLIVINNGNKIINTISASYFLDKEENKNKIPKSIKNLKEDDNPILRILDLK